MNSVGSIFSDFILNLDNQYDKQEAEQVTLLAFEDVFDYKRIDIAINKDRIANPDELLKIRKILAELKSGKPIQYILGYCWFAGLKMAVNSNVLIPRRETEELVDWIVKDINQMEVKPKVILDVCTGSGCIAIALKKAFPQLDIYANDDSPDALIIAKENAANNKTDITFVKMDALKLILEISPDIIVSNPPYVREMEKEQMHSLVTDFEPAHALFVPDNDSLIFYRAISEWAIANMNRNGNIYFEINELMGISISELTSRLGFKNPVIRKDFQEKDRMIKATKV